MDRTWVKQIVLILVAAGLLIGAGQFQRPLSRMATEYELVAPRNAVAIRNPQYRLLTTMFGGLRAPIVTFLWIRAEQYKQEGKFYDALQLAELIGQLMPRFAGVWSYISWNLAWNISVATYTPEERWLWVTNGMKLLRDRGIPLNPRSLVLYKDLGWVFFQKIAGESDEMQRDYKDRWVAGMQELLGAPPIGTTAEVIAAFRPIGEEPLLDRSPIRQAESPIQPDMFARLIGDAPLRRYIEELRRRHAGDDPVRLKQPLAAFVDEHFLALFNRYALDEEVAVARAGRPALLTERDRQVSQWINAGSVKSYRDRILAFVRAQKLWNVFRMDPAWMLELMTAHNVPLDWRLPRSSGLYWSSYGLHVSKGVDAAGINTLNTDRLLLFCLRDMSFYGRLVYQPVPWDPGKVRAVYLSDWRFIFPAHQAYIEAGQEQVRARKVEFKDTLLKDGHINFLIDSTIILYAGGRRDRADQLLTYLKEAYEKSGPEWDMDVDEFVVYHINKDRARNPNDVLAYITAGVQAAFESLLGRNQMGYERSLQFVSRVYEHYQQSAPERIRLDPLEFYIAHVLRYMLIRPEALGIELDILDRGELYRRLNNNPNVAELVLAPIYDLVAPELQRMCEERDPPLGFEQLFPEPAGLEAYRRRMRERQMGQ